MKKVKSPFLKSKSKFELPKRDRKGSYELDLLHRADKAIKELRRRLIQME